MNEREIEFNQIKKGMYISYIRKPMIYQTGEEKKDNKKTRGGYVSFVNQEKEFIGLTSFGKMWSVQKYNVEKFYENQKRSRNKQTNDTNTQTIETNQTIDNTQTIETNTQKKSKYFKVKVKI